MLALFTALILTAGHYEYCYFSSTHSPDVFVVVAIFCAFFFGGGGGFLCTYLIRSYTAVSQTSSITVSTKCRART